MNAQPRLAFTADLHWGHSQRGDEATRALVAFLQSQPPDVLVLAGDIGTGNLFGECLSLFHDLSCRKALVPGNHDIWVHEADEGPDSLQLYREQLPRVAAAFGADWTMPLLVVSACFWIAAFGGFVLSYGPMLIGAPNTR